MIMNENLLIINQSKSAKIQERSCCFSSFHHKEIKSTISPLAMLEMWVKMRESQLCCGLNIVSLKHKRSFQLFFSEFFFFATLFRHVEFRSWESLTASSQRASWTTKSIFSLYFTSIETSNVLQSVDRLSLKRAQIEQTKKNIKRHCANFFFTQVKFFLYVEKFNSTFEFLRVVLSYDISKKLSENWVILVCISFDIKFGLIKSRTENHKMVSWIQRNSNFGLLKQHPSSTCASNRVKKKVLR